jgi:phosphoribosylformimino-5-aminoimidazole carboxamide ribotide isomerase
MKSRFRPCIDLHDGQVKQIVGSSLRDDSTEVATNFVSPHGPEYFANLYRRDGLTGGHVIQLGSGNEEAARCALAAWPGGLQLGGGVNAANAKSWLDAGAAQVIVTSAIFRDGEFKRDELEKIFAVTCRDRLVLDLSCRFRDGAYYIVTDRWQKFTRLAVNAATLAELAGYCCEFLIHAVDVEGKQQGIDRDLIGLLAEASPIPCVYADGIATFDDIKTIKALSQGRIHYTVGSALSIFGGPLSYEAILDLYR